MPSCDNVLGTPKGKTVAKRRQGEAREWWWGEAQGVTRLKFVPTGVLASFLSLSRSSSYASRQEDPWHSIAGYSTPEGDINDAIVLTWTQPVQKLGN